MAYTPRCSPRSEFVELGNTRYHVLHWGKPGQPRLFLLHGWMDAAISFQFVVDALPDDWHVIAPDWRGFGQSQWNQGSYYFPDYLADLDQLLDHYSADMPANLVGHSMGGIVACLYAGVRPERVARLVSIEGFGLAATQPEQAPARLRRWLDELRAPQTFHHHADLQVIAQRLQKTNPRLSDDKALYLASWLAQTTPQGVSYRADPHHKLVNPVLYRLEEAKACWRAITAPTLWIQSDAPFLQAMLKETTEETAERKACFANLQQLVISDSGHMLHHDQPAALAAALQQFLT